MGKQFNTSMISEYNEALSLPNAMEKNIKALAWSNVSKAPRKETPAHEASTTHNSDTLDDGSDDNGFSIPMIELSSTQNDNLNAPWKYSLIAKVLGREMALQYCQVHLHRLWSLEETMDIIDLGYGFFLLKFSLPADYNKVFKGAPWLIHGYNISLRPWVPNFKPSEATITHAKVWVRLPELPIEYYDKEVLLRIGAAIGRTVKIDPITEKQARGRFARLCVEVDLRRSLLPQIKLGELRQKIEYEGHVEQLQQDHSPNSTNSQSSSLTMLADQNPLRTSNASPNVASNNRNTSTNATWPQVPVWKRKCQQETERDSGSQGSKVPKERAMAETGPASSGSRFSVLELENHLDPADEPKTSKGNSEYTSMSTSSTYNGKNIGSNNGMGQKQCPKAGEGKSLFAAETFSPAKNVQLAATELPMPEALTGHVGASVEPTVSYRLHNSKSVKQPQDSLKQLQKPRTSSLPLSSTLSSSKVVGSSFSNNLQPTQGNEVYLPLPASLCNISTPTELQSLQHSNLVMKSASCSAPTSLSLNQPQPSQQNAILRLSPMPDPTIQFHSEVMQRSTKHREIKNKPGLVQELSTESSPTVFSIDSAISDIEIGVSISPVPPGKTNHHSISFIPSQTNHNMHPFLKGQAGKYQSISKAIPESLPKKLLCWNCRGAGDLKFMRAIKDLIQQHNPSIIVLLEPKISGGDAEKVTKEIGLSGQYCIDPEGFAHGIWILWLTEDVHIEVTSSTPHQIHFSVQVLSEAFNSMLCDVGAETHSVNGMPYGVVDKLEPATSLSLNQPQPSKQNAIPQFSAMPDPTIQFHSEVMQRSTKHRKIKSIPALVQLFQELSTESSPTVFSIDSSISVIEIGVSISPLPTGKTNHHSISFTPSQKNHNTHPFLKGQAGKYQSISKAIPESLPKKLLCWNCRGAGDLKFMRAIKDLIQQHNPTIIVLLEPKISGGDAEKVIKEIGLSGQYCIDPEGFAHGIWILWLTEDVRIEVTSSTPNQIHFSVQILSEAFNSMLCDVGAETHSLNGMSYGVVDNLEPFSQPWGPSFFYTSENRMHPPTTEWVPFSKEVEVGQFSSWA